MRRLRWLMFAACLFSAAATVGLFWAIWQGREDVDDRRSVLQDQVTKLESDIRETSNGRQELTRENLQLLSVKLEDVSAAIREIESIRTHNDIVSTACVVFVLIAQLAMASCSLAIRAQQSQHGFQQEK